MPNKFWIKEGDISDGYHTFGELYDHRCLLFINLCLIDAGNAYWAKGYEGWPLLVWESPQGQISYHIPQKFFHLIEGKILHRAGHKWDGHTPDDVLKRLEKLARK